MKKQIDLNKVSKRTPWEIGKTLVFFVRHGERIYIPDNKDLGLRIPGLGLSPKGKKQAKKVARKFSKIKSKIDSLHTSEMKRAIETAEIIGKEIGKKPKHHLEFCEFNKFLWKRRLFHKNFWKHYKLYRKALNKFNEILLKNKGKTIVIVAHGNIISGLVGKKLGLKIQNFGKMRKDNCGVTFARFDGKKLDYLYYFNR